MCNEIIVESYNELIKNCKESIELGIEIDKNELLIKEYKAILDNFIGGNVKVNNLKK